MSQDRMRNYGAMGDSKLLGCIKELENGHGEAVNRLAGKTGPAGSIDDNLAKARHEARRKGLLDGTYVPAGDTEALTEAKFCPECERKQKFYIDDYICKKCRDGVDAENSGVELPEDKEDLLAPTQAEINVGEALKESLSRLTGVPVGQAVAQPTTVSRDYSALSKSDLYKAIQEMQNQDGAAYNRVVNSGEDVTHHLISAQSAYIDQVS